MNPRSTLESADQEQTSAATRAAARKEFMTLVERCSEQPDAIVAELLSTRRARDKAVEAAEELEGLIKGLVDGNATLAHLESIRDHPDGSVRAICQTGSRLQELGVHPDLNPDELRSLQSWEYVLVSEGVVTGVLKDDPALLAAQMGEIVSFEGFANRDLGQVRATRPGHDETIVTLTGDLRIEDLQSGSKLVLQRDDSRYAIAALPVATSESRFEVSLDSIKTRLEELAGVEELAKSFLEDILLRIVFEDARDEFGITPLNGAILYSYKPGMAKSTFCEAIAVTLNDFGKEMGFDIALFHVKPNQLKSMWWGQDGKNVRDLFAAVRAREAEADERPLVVLIVFDEIDSLQKRAGGHQQMGSSSHSDALEALLVEMQGLGSKSRTDGPPVHRLCIGLTNRPDRLDDALKRPGRFGDFVRAMPDITSDSAVDIMAVYTRHEPLRWEIDGEIRQAVPGDTVRNHFLRPAVAKIFPAVVARYATDTQRTADVTAGEILAGAHYEDAVNRAKKRAALRRVTGDGIPAVCSEDIIDSLLSVAVETALQMEADPSMLVQQLQVKVPVVRVTAVPRKELEQHQFLKD